MRSKLMTLAVAAVVPSLAACGGSGGSTSAASGQRSKAAGSGIAGPVHIYRLALTGTAEKPHGASAGNGDAIIAFHGSSLICFRFAHLHGFTNATTAHIHSGPAGKTGSVVVALSTASRLHHQGCVHTAAAVVGSIEHRPQDYYLNIHSTQYPKGAVRAQL